MVTARTKTRVLQRQSRRYWMPPTPRLPPATNAAIPKPRAGVIPMTTETRCCTIFFPKPSKKTSVEDTPVGAPVVKTEEKEIFVAFYTAAPKRVSIRRLARTSHISRPCCERCDESVGQSASPAHPLTFHGTVLPSVPVADDKSRHLELSFRRWFSRPIWPNMCPQCYFCLLFVTFGTCLLEISDHM